MNKNRFGRFLVLIPILLITLIASLFHYPIHFEDALTLTTAEEFSISIPIWRVIFEPIFGPLLFLNRSLYPLEEIPFIFLLVLLLYIIISSIKIIKIKEVFKRKKNIIHKLFNVPLIIGLCFSIFVFMLFIPMPNNTIVNNSKDLVLVTTHSHTEFSHDGLISQQELWEWHKQNGFDAFFITDHANHKKSMEFAEKQRNGEFSINPLVMVGQEHSSRNHMSLLGLANKFEIKGLTDKEVIDSVHFYGGAVLINHWFDGKGLDKEVYLPLGADGFEIENVGKELYYDRNLYNELKLFCEENNLTMVGGLDFHGYGRVSTLYNGFEIPNWDNLNPSEKEREILDIIKNGEQEKIKVLLYKDRTFYTNNSILLRPFKTAINYFRTLNIYQVFSWVFWLVLLQLVFNYKSKLTLKKEEILPISACVSAVFLTSLGIIYHFKGEAVKGYSKVYVEYSALLIPIGLILFIYCLIILYFRFIKKSSAS